VGLLDAKASASATRKAVTPQHPASSLSLPEPSGPSQPPVSPASLPNPARVGLVRHGPGEPFVHYCRTCGAWGAFGFNVDILTGRTGLWHCRDHKP
jgi:hypothetical protein